MKKFVISLMLAMLLCAGMSSCNKNGLASLETRVDTQTAVEVTQEDTTVISAEKNESQTYSPIADVTSAQSTTEEASAEASPDSEISTAENSTHPWEADTFLDDDIETQISQEESSANTIPPDLSEDTYSHIEHETHQQSETEIEAASTATTEPVSECETQAKEIERDTEKSEVAPDQSETEGNEPETVPAESERESEEAETVPHDCVYEFVETVQGDCRTVGYDLYICTCGNEDHRNAAYGDHLYTQYNSQNNATCIADGTKSAVCDTCGSAVDIQPDVGSKRPHDPGVWLSADNLTVTRTCKNCPYQETDSIPETSHALSLAVGNRSSSSPEDTFVCSDCDVHFAISDVLLCTVTQPETDYYRMVITSKIPSAVTYTSMGLSSAPRPDMDIQCEGFDIGLRWDALCDQVDELVLGTYITEVEELLAFNYLQIVTFGEETSRLGSQCLANCYTLDSIYFEGNLPIIDKDSLYTRYVQLGENTKWIEPCVYYQAGAEGFSAYEYKIQGCTLRQLNETIPAAPYIRVSSYSKKTAQKALDMGTEFFKKFEENNQFLNLIPYASLSTYKELKDLSISLTADKTTQKEKAKAIYDWIVANIAYDTNAMYYTVDEIYEKRVAVCSGYATLMHDMLAAVGISSLYTNGMTMDAANQGLTVNQIIQNDPSTLLGSLYPGMGHAWLMIYVDGETIFCDPTWQEFDPTLTWYAAGHLTLGINGLSVIPDEIDPRLYNSAFYYQDGEMFVLSNGQLSVLSVANFIFNLSFTVSYYIHTPNDGYSYGDAEVVVKNAYHDALVEYCERGYQWREFISSDFISYNYMDVLEYVVFEYFYHETNLDIPYESDFLTDDNGIIYFIEENGELSVAGVAVDSDTLIIPDTVSGRRVTGVDPLAFEGSKARAIILPDSITYIGGLAFQNCVNLEEFVIPSSVTTLESGAFAGCSSLKSLTLPVSVNFIGMPTSDITYLPHLIFDGCDQGRLTVYYQGTETDFDKIHFNDPVSGNASNGYFDQAQYDHVKSFVRFAA